LDTQLLAQWVPIYAAIVGTGGLALSLHLAFRDRASLRIFAGPDDPARADLMAAGGERRCFLIHVQNRGRRAVSIERIWYTKHSTGKTRHLLTDRLDNGTQVIREGESIIHDVPEHDCTANDLALIVVEAQDGRSWKGTYNAHLSPPRWNAP
jgi:hypothetical protein